MIIVTAEGRLAHEPELKMGAKMNFCEFRLLSNRYWKGQEYVEAVTFVAWGEMAERFCEYAEKGQRIAATGSQITDQWTDREGGKRTTVRYELTWWEGGPRSNRTRAQLQQPPRQAAAGRPSAPRGNGWEAAAHGGNHDGEGGPPIV